MQTEWREGLGSNLKSEFTLHQAGLLGQNVWTTGHDDSHYMSIQAHYPPPNQFFQELLYFPSRCAVLLQGWLSLQAMLDAFLILGALGDFANFGL